MHLPEVKVEELRQASFSFFKLHLPKEIHLTSAFLMDAAQTKRDNQMNKIFEMYKIR